MPSPQDSDSPPSTREMLRDPDLRIIFAVTLMIVLGVSSIVPVLPAMREHFGVSAARMSWVVTAFILPGVLLAPVAGILADRVGRKAVLVPSLVILGLFGAACYFVDDFALLLALRVVQGVGAAPLGMLANTLIGDIFDGSRLAAAMGLNAGVLSLGIVAYPFLGGALGLLGWNWPFLLSLAAFPVAWLCWRRLDVSTAGSDERLVDYIRRAGRLVSGRNFVGLFLATFLTFILLYGPVITFYPFLAAERFGLESFTIGLLVSVSSVFSAVAAAQLGWLTGFFRERTLILTGFVLYAVCFLITPAVNVAWLLAVPLAIFGTAQGLNIPSIITSMNRRAGNENRGAVMAVNATLLRAGQAAGPALAGLVQTGFGLDGIYVAAAILACVAFATTVALVR